LESEGQGRRSCHLRSCRRPSLRSRRSSARRLSLRTGDRRRGSEGSCPRVRAFIDDRTRTVRRS
jgi:hypothetical protein